MKIKRFVAPDMKTALAEIKEQLGPDAVIMSNKKIPEGVELMAAVDNNYVAPAPQQAEPEAQSASREMAQDTVSLNTKTETQQPEQPQVADSLSALLNRQVQQTPAADTQSIQEVEASIEDQFKSFTERLETNALGGVEQAHAQDDSAGDDLMADMNSFTPATNQSSNDEMAQMRDEMASIRKLLEHQVSGLLWQDMANKNPNRAMIIERLEAMGVSNQMASQFASYIPAELTEAQAWQQMKQVLVEQINTTNNDVIRHGGVVSLVGPTGVGKTTTVAKLAARFAQIHGKDQVAMISTDTYRIAGFEQLSTYGKIIGCDVKLAKDQNELDLLIQQFSNKKLVLIDTAGMGQRDLRLSEYLTTLISNARVRIRNYLVLSANTQPRVMQENVERFKKIPLAGCIFTKLDESLSFGELISTSIQNGLAIGYLTDGQRVPEDIKVANAEKLVTLADKMAEKYYHQTHNSWQTDMSNACA